MALNYSDVINKQVELSFTPPQNFFLAVDKLPSIMYTCQQINVPTISGGEAVLSNRLNPTRTYIPGDGLDYSQMDVVFLLDKKFVGYRAVLEWLKGINMPESTEQYVDWTSGKNNPGRNDPKFSKTMSNMTLFGTSADNKPIMQWNIYNAFPISLDGPQYDATNADIEYLTAAVSFRYSYFTHQTYTNGKLNIDPI